jgi:hypothetical protein
MHVLDQRSAHFKPPSPQHLPVHRNAHLQHLKQHKANSNCGIATHPARKCAKSDAIPQLLLAAFIIVQYNMPDTAIQIKTYSPLTGLETSQPGTSIQRILGTQPLQQLNPVRNN